MSMEVGVLGVGIMVLVVVVLWPGAARLRGWLAMRRAGERVRLEDTLKYLHGCEWVGSAGKVDGLVEVLGHDRERVEGLLREMEERGLVRRSGGVLELTEEGRSYGMRVVRGHRLWETYLADRTGVPVLEWHEEAERREHTLTALEVEALSARLGHPRYDPHGDPIPTAEGSMPRWSGMALTGLEVGEAGVIRHLEDEPREVYERLVGAGLGPGMRVEVLPSPTGSIRIRSGGEEHRLEPVVAGNVTVERVEEAHGEEGVHERGGTGGAAPKPLSRLGPGRPARVVGITHACQGPQRRRLLDLGVVPGTVIEAELVSANGDPVAYRIRGALIALRHEQASWIRVRELGEGEVA
jgi:DtxR family transcriptional regulator, Mn-dependent transcriptional regulator